MSLQVGNLLWRWLRCLGLLIGATALVLSAQPAPIRVYAFDVEPWFIRGTDGRLTGIAVDQINLLVETAGLSPVYHELPWSRGLAYLKSGELDLMPLLSRTPERETFIHFLGSMAQEQNVVLLRRDRPRPELRTLDDFAGSGLRWGIRQDTFYSAEFNARLERDPQFRAHFEIQPRTTVNLEKVRAGRIDGLLGDAIALGYLLERNGAEPFELLEVPFFPPKPIHLGISRKLDPARAQALQSAYDRLSRSHAFEKILDKWMGR